MRIRLPAAGLLVTCAIMPHRPGAFLIRHARGIRSPRLRAGALQLDGDGGALVVDLRGSSPRARDRTEFPGADARPTQQSS
jgi:hypothetical protein